MSDRRTSWICTGQGSASDPGRHLYLYAPGEGPMSHPPRDLRELAFLIRRDHRSSPVMDRFLEVMHDNDSLSLDEIKRHANLHGDTEDRTVDNLLWRARTLIRLHKIPYELERRGDTVFKRYIKPTDCE